jgi:DNA (cytosine-5)-methyltransferase 1
MHKFIEVCAGCGGLSKGFMDAGLEPILINEIDKAAIATLMENHPSIKKNINHGSMTDLKLDGLRPDVLMGGVPCQAFSQAGERRGLEDPRGRLIVEFNRLVLEAEPKIFILENVKGLATHDKGKTLASLAEMFENGGMYTVHHKILNAADYEVPQKRERIIIVGLRSDLGKDFDFPEPIKKRKTLRDALKDVPDSEGIKYSEEKRKVMELVPEGGCWVDLPEEIKKKYMGNAIRSGGGMRGFARRLRMDDQSLTLLTSPSQKQTDRCHPTETRPLTVREYARIQTFPDDYRFQGTIMQKYRQIGNAVPPRLAYHIAKSIIKKLNAN